MTALSLLRAHDLNWLWTYRPPGAGYRQQTPITNASSLFDKVKLMKCVMIISQHLRTPSIYNISQVLTTAHRALLKKTGSQLVEDLSPTWGRWFNKHTLNSSFCKANLIHYDGTRKTTSMYSLFIALVTKSYVCVGHYYSRIQQNEDTMSTRTFAIKYCIRYLKTKPCN